MSDQPSAISSQPEQSHLAKYSGAYIRGALYACVAFLTSFIAEFEQMPAATMAGLSLMAWSVCWAKVFLPTLVTMRAFFDGTLERIKQADTAQGDQPSAISSQPPA